MDITIDQARKRSNRIKLVENTLKVVLAEGRLLDEKKFWVEISEKFDCSERKAKEYITVAKCRIENTKKEEEKNTNSVTS